MDREELEELSGLEREFQINFKRKHLFGSASSFVGPIIVIGMSNIIEIYKC